VSLCAQWSFPLPLPPAAFGFPTGSKLRTLPTGSSRDLVAPTRSSSGRRDGGGARVTDDKKRRAASRRSPPKEASPRNEAPPWADEIAFEVLGPLRFKAVGAFGETAFVHKPTSTLVVTDCVLRVEDEPPPIIAEDPRCLLYHARDNITEEVRNSAETRRKGWRRIAQFGLTFFPSSIDVRVSEMASDAARLPPTMGSLGQGNVPFEIYPWSWRGDADVAAFQKLQGGLLCAPILQALILSRFPDETREWVSRVTRLKFKRIIPCHFSNDLSAGPGDFARAFDFLDASPPAQSAPSVEATGGANSADGGAGLGVPWRRRSFLPLGGGGLRGSPAPCDATNADFDLLRKASSLLTKLRVVDPPKAGPLVGDTGD